MKLVLFDIDGTLLWTDGAGRRSMEHALLATFGVPGDPAYRYDGKTDQQNTREQARDAQAARLCAGVPALLDALEAHDGATLGLLTGNIERGARKKLQAVGLDFDRFRVNAFGCDHADRPQLPGVAQRRAREVMGVDMPGERMVIIGDTPADIQCGRSLGVRAIGVATGRYAVDELAQHAPAAVFPTLEKTDDVLAAILA